MLKFNMIYPKKVRSSRINTDKDGWYSSTNGSDILLFVKGVVTEKRYYRARRELREVTYFHANNERKTTVLFIAPNGYPRISLTKVYGVSNGKYKEWDADGKLYLTASIKSNNVHGVLKFYYSNGNIKECVRVSKGKLHGFLKSYSEDGQLTSMIEFKDGRRYASTNRSAPTWVNAADFVYFWKSKKNSHYSFYETLNTSKPKVTSEALVNALGSLYSFVPLTTTVTLGTWVK